MTNRRPLFGKNRSYWGKVIRKSPKLNNVDNAGRAAAVGHRQF
jgi:hypothetical protein